MVTLRALGQQETNMSLDNTPHPSVKHCADKVNARYIHGRPGHELVPSRYALKVGAIDVMVVSDGVLSLPGAMLGHNVDPAIRAAWLKDMFLPPDVLEWALNVVVVRSGDRTILVDAGMGMEFPDLPRSGRLIPRLQAAGVPGRASAHGQAVFERVPQPAAAVRKGVRGGAGGARHSHRRPHPRAQRGPPGVRRRPADVRRR